MSSPPATPPGAVRVVICDFNALLVSVTGLLRMSGYCVFQAYDGQAAAELCRELPDIGLLVVNTGGTGMYTPALVRTAREVYPGLPVLHIGKSAIPGMPPDVPTLEESFTADQLLSAVGALVRGQPVPAGRGEGLAPPLAPSTSRFPGAPWRIKARPPSEGGAPPRGDPNS